MKIFMLGNPKAAIRRFFGSIFSLVDSLITIISLGFICSSLALWFYKTVPPGKNIQK